MKPLVIGIGNRDRGDDGVGPVIVENLQQMAPDIDTACCAGDLTRLLDLWHGRERVILVDMLASQDAAPGTVHCFDIAHDDGTGYFTAADFKALSGYGT